MDRKYIKSVAKAQLKDNYLKTVIIAFLMSMTGYIGSSFSNSYYNNEQNLEQAIDNSINTFVNLEGLIVLGLFAVVIISFLAYFIFQAVIADVLYAGGVRYFLKRRKNQPVEIEEIIANFKDKTYRNMAKINISKQISVFLWSLLFVIPGIIKGFEYYAINYILAVRPDISKDEAFRISKNVMHGHKMELFELYFSFIGWFLLSAFVPFGLLSMFYVKPYLTLAEVEFMCAVRQKAIFDGVISPFDFPDYEEYNPPMPNFNPPTNNDVNTQNIDLNPINRGFDDRLENNGVDNTSPDYSNEPYTPTQTEVDFKDVE